MENLVKLKKYAVLLMVALLLIACSSKDTQTTKGKEDVVTLTFANWVSAEEATAEGIEKVIASFEEEHPNVKIENMPIPFDQMRQQLLTMTSGGNPPDIAMLNGPWSQELGAQGALLDLSSLAPDEYLEDNWEGGLEAGEYEDALYAVPFSLTPHAFWYNKKLMEEAGLDPDNPPKTLEELNDAMEKIKHELGSEGVYPIGIDTTLIDYALVQFWPWLYAHGAEPLYNNEVNFNSDEVKNSLEWLRQVVDNDYTPVGQQIKELRELTAKDKMVFRIDGPYLKGIIESLNPDYSGDAFYENFGVTTIPVGVNDESKTLADIHQLGISAGSKHQELAWEFIEFLVTSEVSTNEYQIPSGVIPALKSTQSEISDPITEAYYNEVFDTMVGGPYGPEYGQAQQVIIEAMQKASLSEDSIDDIVDTANKSLEEILNN
ncbi:ABC transporter substrate-binding protein [Pseudogracilibacillus sp. SO30301A]|uniref:ABC transporter substrate-binding protein n=1 Tax=Pseudogracilibacillus sp. SO30301A TaxID=3098291 RepID=UPI00300E5797